MNNDLWDRLLEVAARTGSRAERGTRVGKPSWRTMVRRIAEGELVVVSAEKDRG